MKTNKNQRKTKSVKIPKVGEKIYVDSSYYISHGSDDFEGGLATVTKVYKSMSGGNPNCIFVDIKEGEKGYNWTQFLSKDQGRLKKEFGKQRAHPSPDIDTPWIEEGDTVYHGPLIW